MTYVLLRYENLELDEDDFSGPVWCLLAVKSDNRQLGKVGTRQKFEVERFVGSSKNFDSVFFDPEAGNRVGVAYLPHMESDGKVYVTVSLSSGDNDEILEEFDNDNDALLYVEAKQ